MTVIVDVVEGAPVVVHPRELSREQAAELLRAAADVLDPPAAELSDPDAQQLGPFARRSATSRRAAVAAYPKQGTQRRRIIEALAVAPATRDELAGRLGLSPNTIRPRVVELIGGGWVEETSATRQTVAGRDAVVLALTPEGAGAHAAGDA